MSPALIVVFTSLLVLTAATGGQYVAVVAMVPMTEEMDWPRAVPSTAYAVSLLGMGIGGILMGKWSDRVGVGPPVAVGAVMIAVGSVWASFASSGWELVAANGIFIGLFGTAAFFAPLMANTTRWFTARRGIAVGIVSAGQSLGGAIWPPIHRYVIEEAGWRTAYFSYALVALVLCVPLAWFLRARPPERAAEDSTGPGSGARLGSRTRATFGLKVSLRTLHVVLCFAIVGCCVAMSMPMVHVIAHATELGHPPARAAEVLAILLLTSFVSRLLWGMLSDRIGGLLTLFISSGSQAVMLCAFLMAEQLWSLYAVSALYGLAYGGVVPTYAVIVREYFPEAELGWRMGMIYLFGTVGMALGGVVGGFVFDQVGNYFAAFSVGVAFNVGNLALIAGLLFRESPVATIDRASEGT